MQSWTEFSFILKPSSIGGIGVFATHDISIGTRVFSGNFTSRKVQIKDVHPDFLKYCIYVNDNECLSPERFDHMQIGWYLNHSDKPNIAKNSEGLVLAVRDIKAGDEIFCDYNQLNEPDHLKEAYYWQPKNN